MDFYSENLINHFLNPRFIGNIKNADSIGEQGDPSCGDFLRIWIKIKDDIIKDIRFKCHGCPAAIATSEALCGIAIDKKLDEAYQITDEIVSSSLSGLPLEKEHCSNLGSGALKNAIDNFRLNRETS